MRSSFYRFVSVQAGIACFRFYPESWIGHTAILCLPMWPRDRELRNVAGGEPDRVNYPLLFSQGHG